MLLIALVMGAWHRYGAAGPVIPAPWNRLGAAVIALALLAPLAAIVQFWRARTTVDPHRPERARALVTSGVYAFTRNPMYLGLALLLLGWAMLLGDAAGFAGPPLFMWLIERVQIRAEERRLSERFGEDYATYVRHVNRWIGRRESRDR